MIGTAATSHESRFELTKSHKNIGYMKKTKSSLCIFFPGSVDRCFWVERIPRMWGDIWRGCGEWGVSRKFAADTCPFCPVPQSFRHAFPLSIISDSDINGWLNRSGLGNPGLSFSVSYVAILSSYFSRDQQLTLAYPKWDATGLSTFQALPLEDKREASSNSSIQIR